MLEVFNFPGFLGVVPGACLSLAQLSFHLLGPDSEWQFFLAVCWVLQTNPGSHERGGFFLASLQIAVGAVAKK